MTVGEVKGIKPVFFGTGNNDKNSIYATDFENLGLEGSSAVIHVKEGDEERKFEVNIPLPGEHMLHNALAATAAGISLGLGTDQIKKGIETVEPVGGRSHVIKTERFTVIDDCYNANPVSVKSALDLLASTKGKRLVAILGDMFELGEDEKKLHYNVGEYAASKDIDELICVGDLCINMYDGAKSVDNPRLKLHYYATKKELFDDMDNILDEKDIILVKASHGMYFDEIIKEITKRLA
jgi:UDP-N-acetylmuramoyl-tripeptide--D-alanyl-D-alanine ligase